VIDFVWGNETLHCLGCCFAAAKVAFLLEQVHDKTGDTGGKNSTRTWKVGLATADSLGGPWRRLNDLNPAEYIESPEGIENPIVTKTSDGKYWVAVYDALMRAQIMGDEVRLTSTFSLATHFRIHLKKVLVRSRMLSGSLCPLTAFTLARRSMCI
jgi:hypothetical protein